jgi:hypothetical protein
MRWIAVATESRIDMPARATALSTACVSIHIGIMMDVATAAPSAPMADMTVLTLRRALATGVTGIAATNAVSAEGMNEGRDITNHSVSAARST